MSDEIEALIHQVRQIEPPPGSTRRAAALQSLERALKGKPIAAVTELCDRVNVHLDGTTTINEGNHMDNPETLRAAQLRAQPIYHANGDSAPAPLAGEGGLEYRRRLASRFQSLARDPRGRGIQLNTIRDASILDLVEDAIFNDALAAPTDRSNYRPGELRAVVTMDQANRPITKYYGDPNACWDQFNPPIRYVRKILTPGMTR